MRHILDHRRRRRFINPVGTLCQCGIFGLSKPGLETCKRLMNINEPIRHLGPIKIDALKSALLSESENAWLANTQRQNSYEVHRQTRSLVLVFCDGPVHELVVSKENAWNRLATAAVPVMHELIQRSYPAGGTIIRAMAANLVAGGRILPHFDSHKSFQCSHRIHVPITTNPRVRFMIDGRPHRLEVGEAYEINNQKTHSVINTGKDDRITFIFDYMPPDHIGTREVVS